jgi:hypothetical protein
VTWETGREIALPFRTRRSHSSRRSLVSGVLSRLTLRPSAAPTVPMGRWAAAYQMQRVAATYASRSEGRIRASTTSRARVTFVFAL